MVGIAGVVGVLVGAVVVVEAAGGDDGDVAAADGQYAVALHALTARAGGGERQGAAVDGDVMVGADAAGRFGLLVVGIPHAFAAGGHIDDGFAADEDVSHTGKPFGGDGGAVDGDIAALDVDIAAVLVLVVLGDARRGVALEVALDAVVTRTADIKGATLHQEILVARDAVALGRGDVDCGVLDGDILAGLDGVLEVARHVEGALLRKLGVALHIETALLRAAGGVGQGIGGAGDDLHLDALAVLYMHRGAAVDGRGVSQRQAVELDGRLIGARHVELAVGRRAAEVVGNLGGQVAALRNRDVRALLRDGQVLTHIVGHRHRRRIAIINHIDGARGGLRRRYGSEHHYHHDKNRLFHCLFIVLCSVDGLDLVAEEFDVELLVGDGVGVGEVLAVGVVGLAVVFGGFLEEAAGDVEFELGEVELALPVVFYILLGEVFAYLLEFVVRQASVVVEAPLEVWEVDPRGDGGFEECYLLAVAVGVVAEVGVTGFDEDDGLEAEFAEDGGEEDAGIDAVGLSGVVDFVEEADVLDVGAGRGVGGAGDGGIGYSVVEGVVPDGEDLVGDVGGAVGLVAGEAGDGALGDDVGEYLFYLWVVFVDVGGEEPAEVGDLAVVGEGEGTFVDGAAGEVEVFDVDFLVVDVAGEGEVDGLGESCATEDVVFPFEGGCEGVLLAAAGKYFLKDGDVVEGGGVDDDAEDAVVGGSGEGEVEEVEVGGSGLVGGED